MQSYDVRVFEVPRVAQGEKFDAEKHKPRGLSPATVKCSNTDAGKRQLRERFEAGEGRKVRSINVGPNEKTGRHEFIVYLHGDEDGSTG